MPVYNEEKIIKNQINKIKQSFNVRPEISYEIIISENGSTDKTLEICSDLQKEENVFVISNTVADYGRALRAGMLKASGKIIVSCDIDYYDIDFLFQSLALEPFSYDIIVASKNARLSNDNRHLSRRMISSLYKYILYYGFGLRVSDTHGIKAWRNDDILKSLINSTINNKEIFDTELIVRSQYANRKLLELPINITETRKSVTPIFRRALRGFYQIVKLLIYFKIKRV